MLNIIMSHKLTVRVLVDVDCMWTGEPPRYRLFVAHEMFTERTWIWPDCYLEEALTIVAAPGKYTIRGELVEPYSGALTLTNWRIDRGPGRITHTGELEIFDEIT
jgi:hypothetical protein